MSEENNLSKILLSDILSSYEENKGNFNCFFNMNCIIEKLFFLAIDDFNKIPSSSENKSLYVPLKKENLDITYFTIHSSSISVSFLLKVDSDYISLKSLILQLNDNYIDCTLNMSDNKKIHLKKLSIIPVKEILKEILYSCRVQDKSNIFSV